MPSRSLASLSQISDPEEFSYAFRNFLDAFYAEPSIAQLQAPPQGPDRTRNAYLAATADFLCNKYQLSKPPWLILSDDDSDPLVADPPYFASSHWKTRIWLLADSPQEFRQRNLFVGADALSRT
jgi:hypothetical protein